jgi:DNA-directed RNA polymerase specialized sigma24 family protein
VVANTVRDSFGRKKRRPGGHAVGGSAMRSILEQIEGHDGVAEWMDQLETEMQPERRLAQRAAAAVKTQVSTRDWDVFWRTAVEKQKGADVAANLGMTVAAVHQVKCRVVKKLREMAATLLD